MSTTIILEFINLFFSGILADSLFVIDYGLRKPLRSLEARPQIQVRQALIYRLRILVPATFGATLLSGVAVAVSGWFEPGSIFRVAGVLALLACFLFTLLGTAPINKSILAWQPETPPDDWREQVSRWETLDAIRTWIGIASFILMLMAMAFRLVSR